MNKNKNRSKQNDRSIPTYNKEGELLIVKDYKDITAQQQDREQEHTGTTGT